MKTLYTDQAHCVIELLSGSPSEKGRRIPGSFHSFERQQLLVTTDHPFSLASAVTVQHEDVLFIGEVMACGPEVEKDGKVLIKVHQLLNGLQSLTILRERLLWREDQPHLIPVTTSSVLARI
jgi:hypothetical protein